MHEPLERLFKLQMPEIVQHLCYEPRIQQVRASMLRSADITIDGQHFIDRSLIERRVGIVRVRITQIVPRRAHESIERIGLAAGGLAADRTYRLDKLRTARERRFAVGREIDAVRKLHGQILFGHGHCAAMLAVYHRNGRAPISLTRHRPIAHAIVYLFSAVSGLFEFFEHGNLAFRARHAGKFAAVGHNAVLGERQTIVCFGGCAFYNALDLEFVLERKGVVARVVRRNAHDRARAVSGQAVVRDIYGNALAVYGIDAITAREHARLFLGRRSALYLSALCGVRDILFDGGFLFRHGERGNIRMLGCENNIAHAV